MYRIWVYFCLYHTFLPVTSSFHPFRIRRHLIFELICGSIKIYAFRNPDSTCWTAYRCFIFASIETLQCSVASPCHYSLKNKCFQNYMCAETTLREFAISLVLVISCVPTESRRSVECLHMTLKQSSLFHYILAYMHIYMSADLRKGSFGHFSSFCVIKISKTSKFSSFCMFLQ